MRTKLIVFAAAIFFTLSTAHGQKKEDPPNIVFFLVDDLGWRDLGCYGSDFYETPNIDRFASEGVRFTRAYAACHVCSPTRASILTGKYPARLNLTDYLPGRKEFAFQKLKNAEIIQHLPYEESTLAEILKKHGYSTAIIGKWHLGKLPSGPLAHGFDRHTPSKWTRGWPETYYAPFRLNSFNGEKGEYLTDRLTDEALSYMANNRDNPFFLYMAHFAVHDPIQGREDLVEKYRNKLKNREPEKGPPYMLEGNPDSASPLSKAEKDALLKEKAYQGYSALPNRTVKIKQHQDNVHFAAMVESVDESLGRILLKLKELEIADNTIVILASDNGGMAAANFGNPNRNVNSSNLDKNFSTSNLPLRGAKGWLYEGGIRVPMIVKWPGHGKGGTVCNTPVISTDFFPSILEMAGLPLQPEQHKDGVSFVPLLKGERKLERKALYWHFPHYSNHGMQSPGGAILMGDYKLIEYFENNTVQLFDLSSERGEFHDIAAVKPKKVEELRQMLNVWRKAVGAQMMELNPAYISKQ